MSDVDVVDWLLGIACRIESWWWCHTGRHILTELAGEVRCWSCGKLDVDVTDLVRSAREDERSACLAIFEEWLHKS